MKNLIDKLRVRGAGGLSDAELLGAVVGDGTERCDVVEYAARIIDSAGGLGELARCDFSRLRMTEGMGVVRAARIAAAAELGRRMAVSEVSQRPRVATERDVEELFRPQMAQLNHEECWVLYLSSANEIIERSRVSQGGVQGTVVDCRLVVKRALELLASRMIMVHNHPSGSAEASEADRDLTLRLESAAALFDIPLLDHIIIARTGTYSFRRAGLLK